MRSLLEKAIVHLLNEEQEKFEKLIHEFMVQRGRQIHEKLRQGEDVSLTEGWDDEVTTESYFTEADLDDAEDDMMGHNGGPAMGDAAADDADMAAGDAADDLEADMEGEDGADMGDDAGMGDDDMGDGDIADRVEDVEAQVAKLTAEFEKAMAEDGDDMDDEESMEDGDMAGDDMEGGDADMGDAGDDMDAMAGDDAEGDDMEEPEPKMEGKVPPQFLKHMKDKKGDDEGDDEKEKVDEADDFEDITESVLADLEKVVIDLHGKDGTETDGTKVAGFNKTSPIPQKPVTARNPGNPVVTGRGERHTGFERESAPSVDSMKARKNTHASAKGTTSPVAKPGNSEPKEGPAGGKAVNANKHSPVMPRKGRESKV